MPKLETNKLSVSVPHSFMGSFISTIAVGIVNTIMSFWSIIAMFLIIFMLIPIGIPAVVMLAGFGTLFEYILNLFNIKHSENRVGPFSTNHDLDFSPKVPGKVLEAIKSKPTKAKYSI